MSSNCGIYALKNTADGKVYIGQSVDVAERLRAHFRSLASGTHYNAHLQASWNKYGGDVFETQTIELCGEEVLDAREIAWISYYQSAEPEFGYNREGGGRAGRVLTVETRAKMSVARRLRPAASPETRAKMSAARKRRVTSPETRAKMSEVHKRIAASPEYRAKLSAAQKLRPPASPETRAKISAAHKGLTRSPEARAKMSAAQRLRLPPSPETRAKMSAAHKRRPAPSPETRAKMSAALKGRVPSTESCLRQAESMKRFYANKHLSTPAITEGNQQL